MAALVAAAELPVPATAQSRDCSCEKQLDALIGATQSNYAGYEDKVGTASDSIVHTRFAELLRRRALRTPGAVCLTVLKNYIRFFQDGHLQVRSTIAGAALALLAPTVADTDTGVHDARLGARIEGVWASSSGRTRLQIVPAAAPYSHRDFHAIVRASADTSWSSGDMYATFVFDPDRGVYHATWFVRGRQRARSGSHRI